MNELQRFAVNHIQSSGKLLASEKGLQSIVVSRVSVPFSSSRDWRRRSQRERKHSPQVIFRLGPWLDVEILVDERFESD